MLDECDTISVKRGESYLKLIELDLAGSIGDVEGRHLILNSILMSKEHFEVNLDSLKTTMLGEYMSL